MGRTPAEARNLEELELLVGRALGGYGAPPEIRDRAYSRALALLQDEAARGGASRAASIGFVLDLLAGRLIELTADLPALSRLIHRLETDARLTALELGREFVRVPQLLEMPPITAIDVELRLLVAFSKADVVSLWKLSSHELPEPIAFAGKISPDDARTRRVARALLVNRAADLRGSPTVTGLPISGTQPRIAVVCRRSSPATCLNMLLLEAALPVLAATLLRDDKLSGSSAPKQDANRKSSQLPPAERRLARVRFDLHDGPQQDLMLLAQDLRLFRSQLDPFLTQDETRKRVMGRFDDLEAQLVAIDGDIRRISVSAQSPFLQDESLPKALARLVDAFTQRTGIAPKVDLHGDFTKLTDSQHITLLGLIGEALNNIREHAHAEHVAISLSSSARGVEASVTDDGRGFEPETMLVEAARQGHLGLVGMHERVHMLDGHTRIDSRPGGPTVISVTLPPAPVSAPRRTR